MNHIVPTSYPFRLTILPGAEADIRIGTVVFGQEIVKISSINVLAGGTIVIDTWAIEGAGDDEVPVAVSEG